MLPDMDVDVLESRRKEIQRELALIGDLRPGVVVRALPKVRQARLPLRCGRGSGARAEPGADGEGRRQAADAGHSARRGGADAGADRGASPLQGTVATPGGGERGAVPGTACGGAGRGAERPKRGLRESLTEMFAADLAAEIDALAGPGAADGIDFEVLETAVRRQALGLAARLVERRLNADRGDHAGGSLACGGCCGRAAYAGRRRKAVTTVLGPMRLERAYYHCATCNAGFHPRDRALGIEGRGAVAGGGAHDGVRAHVRVRAGARGAGPGGAAAVPEHAVRGERLGAVPAGEVRAPPTVAGGVADAVGARPRRALFRCRARHGVNHSHLCGGERGRASTGGDSRRDGGATPPAAGPGPPASASGRPARTAPSAGVRAACHLRSTAHEVAFEPEAAVEARVDPRGGSRAGGDRLRARPPVTKERRSAKRTAAGTRKRARRVGRRTAQPWRWSGGGTAERSCPRCGRAYVANGAKTTELTEVEVRAHVRVRAGARPGPGGAAAVPEHAVRGERLGAAYAHHRPLRAVSRMRAPWRSLPRFVRFAGGGALRRDELDGARARRARRQSALLAVGVPDRGRGALARRSVAQRGGGAGVVHGPRRRGSGAPGLRPLRRPWRGRSRSGSCRPCVGRTRGAILSTRPSAVRSLGSGRALAGTHCGVVSRRSRTGAALGPRAGGRQGAAFAKAQGREGRAAALFERARRELGALSADAPQGKPLRALERHREGLTAFLRDPTVPLDNNAAHADNRIMPRSGSKSLIQRGAELKFSGIIRRVVGS